MIRYLWYFLSVIFNNFNHGGTGRRMKLLSRSIQLHIIITILSKSARGVRVWVFKNFNEIDIVDILRGPFLILIAQS